MVPGVDVDVRVELDHGDPQAACLQQRAQRGGGDTLAERRDDAAGDEDELGFRRTASPSRAFTVDSLD
jgi:hypothetical protein